MPVILTSTNDLFVLFDTVFVVPTVLLPYYRPGSMLPYVSMFGGYYASVGAGGAGVFPPDVEV